MSEDVFCKLKDLHHDVRTRIEATADWKALMAVERAMGDVKALLPVAAAEAPVVAAAEAAPEVAAEAEPIAAEDAETGADGDAAEALAADAPGEAATAEVAPASDAEPVAAPEIPAEHQALVEEIVSSGAVVAGTGDAATA